MYLIYSYFVIKLLLNVYHCAALFTFSVGRNILISASEAHVACDCFACSLQALTDWKYFFTSLFVTPFTLHGYRLYVFENRLVSQIVDCKYSTKDWAKWWVVVSSRDAHVS
jgi:hypothetical protein